MKSCCNCNQVKSLEEFPVVKKAKDGRHGRCRVCAAEYHREYYLRNKEKLVSRNKRYRDTHKAEISKMKRVWRKKNIDRVLDYNRKWKENNLERARRNSLNGAHRRRIRKYANGVYSVTANDLRRIKEQPCLYCGSLENITADHVIPISRGGTHSVGNLVPACLACNSSKHNKTITEWKKVRV